MKIILIGAPASGKGTQAKLICAKYRLAHISTGDIIREKIKEGTPLAVELKSYTDKGRLVPDELILQLFTDRIKQKDCLNGYLLDGYPRTRRQAEELSKLTEIDKVIYLDISFEELFGRISERRVCRQCAATLKFSDLKDGICPHCEGEVYIRSDDNEETFKERYRVYSEQTTPLITYYQTMGLLETVKMQDGADKNFNNIDLILSKIKA